MSPARWLRPFVLLSLVASLAAIASPARADDRRVVATQAILTGPRWYLGETPRGHLTSARGDAVTVVLGRDLFTPDGTTALVAEAHLTSAIGGRGVARAGVSLGVKARSASRVELGAALVLADDLDPDHLRDVSIAPGALAQLAYDLDDSRPFSTRVLLRAAVHRATDTLVTVDAFIGLGTRWP